MKSRTLGILLRSIIPVSFLFFASQALDALEPCLGYAAISCAPWHEAIEKNSYFQVAGRIKHKGNSTGTIQVFCPVFNTTGGHTAAWNNFSMLYQDSDGTETGSQVTAALRFIDISGHVESIASLDSNEHFPSTTSFREMSTTVSHSFDFSKRRYYVQITVTRKAADLAPAIGAFNICEFIE